MKMQSSTPGKLEDQDLLVLGIGNPLMGDDGVGNRVIELLAEGRFTAQR